MCCCSCGCWFHAAWLDIYESIISLSKNPKVGSSSPFWNSVVTRRESPNDSPAFLRSATQRFTRRPRHTPILFPHTTTRLVGQKAQSHTRFVLTPASGYYSSVMGKLKKMMSIMSVPSGVSKSKAPSWSLCVVPEPKRRWGRTRVPFSRASFHIVTAQPVSGGKQVGVPFFGHTFSSPGA